MSVNTDKVVKLYYEFGGSIDWLREEIIKKRYDSFRYLLPIQTKEKANIIIEIQTIENIDDKLLNISSVLKFANIINLTKVVCKNFKISSQDCNKIYDYLKETYYEK